jgi:hypothetical protein
VRTEVCVATPSCESIHLAATAAATTETVASTQVVVATTAGIEGEGRRKSQRMTRPSKKVLENIADTETVNEEKVAGEIGLGF